MVLLMRHFRDDNSSIGAMVLLTRHFRGDNSSIALEPNK